MSRLSDKPSGMYVFGTVKERRKREIEKSGDKIEIVTYEVADDDGHLYYVEAFDPEEYYDRAQYVQIPIYIKAYKKKNGDPAYTINVKGVVKSFHGESF